MKPISQPLFTLAQVAEMLGVGPLTIHRELKDAKLGGFKIRGQWRFNQEHIDDYLESRSIKPRRKKLTA